jgi:hypothetical protein
MSKPLNIRMPDDLVEWIESKMPEKGKTYSGVILTLLYEMKAYTESRNKNLDVNLINELIHQSITENNKKWEKMVEQYFQDFAERHNLTEDDL